MANRQATLCAVHSFSAFASPVFYQVTKKRQQQIVFLRQAH
jgi:hypothetical protein